MRGRRDFSVLFKPSERISLSAFTETKHFLILTELDNVRSRAYALRNVRGKWTHSALDAPSFGTVSLEGIDSEHSDEYFMRVTEFSTPPSLSLASRDSPARKNSRACPPSSTRVAWKPTNLKRSRRTAR